MQYVLGLLGCWKVHKQPRPQALHVLQCTPQSMSCRWQQALAAGLGPPSACLPLEVACPADSSVSTGFKLPGSYSLDTGSPAQ